MTRDEGKSQQWVTRTRVQSQNGGSWRQMVLAAEAKKAGSASEEARLKPRSLSLIGRLA